MQVPLKGSSIKNVNMKNVNINIKTPNIKNVADLRPELQRSVGKARIWYSSYSWTNKVNRLLI